MNNPPLPVFGPVRLRFCLSQFQYASSGDVDPYDQASIHIATVSTYDREGYEGSADDGMLQVWQTFQVAT
jgi:hypothetical protein